MNQKENLGIKLSRDLLIISAILAVIGEMSAVYVLNRTVWWAPYKGEYVPDLVSFMGGFSPFFLFIFNLSLFLYLGFSEYRRSISERRRYRFFRLFFIEILFSFAISLLLAVESHAGLGAFMILLFYTIWGGVFSLSLNCIFYVKNREEVFKKLYNKFLVKVLKNFLIIVAIIPGIVFLFYF